MCDVISRRDAVDAIDKIFPADPMRNDYTQGITCGAALATEYIKQLPSAQPDLSGYSDRLWKAAYERGKADAQPEIIHCGECKYYHDSDGCFFSTATTGADGFCHWAERKEGGADEQT